MNEKKGKRRCRTVQNHNSGGLRIWVNVNGTAVPARIVIIDITEPRLEASCENISVALEEFLVLHNSLPGAPRLQLFSLFVIGDHVECVVPLQNTRTNYQKIIHSVHALKTYDDIMGSNKATFEEHFSFILMESFNQLQQMSKYVKPTNSPSQFDVCLFTNQRHIEKQAAAVLKEHDMNSIKKVQIVHLSSIMTSEGEVQSSTESPGSADSGTTEILCGYIESMFLQNDRLSLEQFFKSWLQDTGSDDIHLVIEFDTFSVKCDLADTVVNPLHIANGRNLILETDLNITFVNNSLSTKSKQSGLTVYSLKPKMRIRSKHICESVLYGLPLISKPTTCWKLDWEELEKNQSFFSSLNAYLQKEESTLLLEQVFPNSMTSYFLLLPSSGGTMLIKSIATSDIMMPRDSGVAMQTLVVRDEVQEEMEKLVIGDDYNPLNFTCGLFSRIPKVPEAAKKSATTKSTVFTSSFMDASAKKRPLSNELSKNSNQPMRRTTDKYVPRFNARTMAYGNTMTTEKHSTFKLAGAFDEGVKKKKKALFQANSDN